MTYILGAWSRHLNPGLGEECAGSKHEEDVEDSMDGVLAHVSKCLRGRQVVAQTTHGVGASGSAASNILQINRGFPLLKWQVTTLLYMTIQPEWKLTN